MVEIQQPSGEGGTPITFGDPTQIPYVNALSDDFDYSANLTWNNATSRFAVGGKASFSGGLFSPWTKTIIVDAGGRGDYTTIKDACDYVATQSPSTSNRWQVLVMNGKYLESPFTVPAFTTVNGFIPTTWGNFESVEINMTTTFTSGTGIDMTNTSNLANLTVIWSDFGGSQTGDIDLILARGNNKMAGVYIQSWTADAATLNAIKITSGSFYSNNLTIEYGNFGAGVGRGIYETGGNFSGFYDKSRFRGYIADQWGYEKDTTAGASILFDCVFDGPASVKRTGTGTVTMQLGSYILNSGTITYVGKTSVADEAYGAGWDGSQEVPTKNALYDKIETITGASGSFTTADAKTVTVVNGLITAIV